MPPPREHALPAANKIFVDRTPPQRAFEEAPAQPQGKTAEHQTVRLADWSETWLPRWVDEAQKIQPWNIEAYKNLRQTIESLPPSVQRDDALDRIASLDCANRDPTLASCNPSLPLPADATAWRKSLEEARLDDAAYFKTLASVLKSLVCTGGDEAIDILRGMLGGFRSTAGDLVVQRLFTSERLGQSRLVAVGPEAPALIDFILSPSCLVSSSLKDGDRAELIIIKQDAIRRAGG